MIACLLLLHQEDYWISLSQYMVCTFKKKEIDATCQIDHICATQLIYEAAQLTIAWFIPSLQVCLMSEERLYLYQEQQFVTAMQMRDHFMRFQYDQWVFAVNGTVCRQHLTPTMHNMRCEGYARQYKQPIMNILHVLMMSLHCYMCSEVSTRLLQNVECLAAVSIPTWQK